MVILEMLTEEINCKFIKAIKKWKLPHSTNLIWKEKDSFGKVLFNSIYFLGLIEFKAMIYDSKSFKTNFNITNIYFSISNFREEIADKCREEIF